MKTEMSVDGEKTTMLWKHKLKYLKTKRSESTLDFKLKPCSECYILPSV